MLAKENARNTELLFAMNTGGNVHNYDKYLESNPDRDMARSGGSFVPTRDKSANKKKQIDDFASYDKAFEDAF